MKPKHVLNQSHLPSPSKVQPPGALLPAEYPVFLAAIKRRVQAAQVHATLSANHELISLYWDIGLLILNRQKAEGWGAKVVARLATDLQREFPAMSGFSRSNLL